MTRNARDRRAIRISKSKTAENQALIKGERHLYNNEQGLLGAFLCRVFEDWRLDRKIFRHQSNCNIRPPQMADKQQPTKNKEELEVLEEDDEFEEFEEGEQMSLKEFIQ